MASLIDCQFCGVAFQLGRVRRPNEPSKAAWTPVDAGYLTGDDDECTGRLCEWLEHTEEEARKDQYPTCGSKFREHLAGADCTLEWGYSGARILAEEMNGFCYVQCLIEKTANWQPNVGDLDYEKDSDYFLSGIFHCPDPEELEFDYIESSGQRHGTNPVYMSNFKCDMFKDIELNENDQGDYRDPIPFHPECFEIFTRISKHRLGRIDLNGLRSWRDAFESFTHFHNSWPSDPAARDARAQGSWDHDPGSEYLAANPLNIPGLEGAVTVIAKDQKAVIRELERDGKRTPDGSYTNSDNDETEDRNPCTDRNPTLSSDVREKLRNCYNPREFENLMASSPELQNTDRACWKQLILEEMPWFWEVGNLRFAVTDYKKLYLRLKYSLCFTFKGLHNRKRIWEDMELICDFIALQNSQ